MRAPLGLACTFEGDPLTHLPAIGRSAKLLVGVSLALNTPTGLTQTQSSPLQIRADAHDGSYTLSAPNIASPVLHATAAAKIDGRWLRAADFPRHEITVGQEGGELGTAQVTTILYTGRSDGPDLEVKLRSYAGTPFGDAQVTAVNRSHQPIQVQVLRVLEATQGAGKRNANTLLDLGGAPAADRVLSDSFSEDRPALQMRDLGDPADGMHRAVGLQLVYNQQSHQSFFLGALSSEKFLSVLRLHMSPANKTTIASYEVDSTGTTELLRENSLQTSPEKDRVELSLAVAPGGRLASERMLFGIGTDYHRQLETYAHLVRDLHHARVSGPTPIGWWSWTAYYFGLNQGTALTNAQWLAQHLEPLGYSFFHIDEGYQFARGEYAIPDSALFPQGLGALENKVLSMGLTPGIWTAPFEVSERSWVYANHPEWLVHNLAGEPIHIGTVVEGVDKLYALDPTHPGAQGYLRSTYATLAQWGIRYIKMDFMEDSAVEGVYHVPQTTALEAQRIGIRVIREAVGEDVLLDKDGCELLNPVGLVDTGRISQDTGHTFSSSKDAASGVAARYYMNRNYFLSDPDAFSVSTQTVDDQHWHGGSKPLTLEEARVSIALSAVSGGLYEIGDDLPTLGESAERLALVENRDLLDMARLGRASVPIDLMTYRAADLQPSIFLLKESARQSIVTLFNWSEQPQEHSLDRATLGLRAPASYSVTELVTPGSSPVPLGSVLSVQQPAHSVRLFRIVDNGIASAPPVVAAVVQPSAKVGEAVKFSASSPDENNPALDYTWDFGDGVTMGGIHTVHTYTHAGTYTAHLHARGFGSEPFKQASTVTITGAVATNYAPEQKRRYDAARP